MENFIFCAVWNTGNAIYFLPQMATKYDNVMVGYTFSWKYGSLMEIQNFFVKMLWYTKLSNAYEQVGIKFKTDSKDKLPCWFFQKYSLYNILLLNYKLYLLIATY